MSKSCAVQIGARLRRQRTKMGLTREQLAELLGVTPKFCADLELGQRGMSVDTLCNLSHVLHLSTDYILFGSQENETLESISAMLHSCPAEKLPYAENLLCAFFSSFT